ncbi:ABC transporter substrate-binding protein [Nocardioides limicola]|uniref:ABC transporter substrate-binding protein n=1 Tax=Nocardioides limicola TaxID=2803368 RepID=UPI00193B39EE|nr:ABC transporter substrate-binding protein [Nocardioides sp. DJM-14]
MSRLVRRGTALASIASLSLVAALSACAASGSQTTPADAAAPVTVTDATGTEITLDAPAERVVCLDTLCLDALIELGVTPVASAQQQTLTDPHFFGPDADVDPIGGSFFEPDLEAILAAQPDLVVGSASVHGDLRSALGSVPLYTSSLREEGAAVANLTTMGQLLGREDAAAEALERHRQTLEGYVEREREVSVLSMYGGATADIGIDAADSTIGRLLQRYTNYPWPDAGQGDSGFLEINLETILDVDPEWIWILDFGFDPNAPALVEQLAEEPVWETLTAVRNGNVVVTPRWWGGVGGTHTQQLVLDHVLPQVYPDEFPEPLGPLSR